jgi:DNA uptake protein ComE-like DNA-binding protein
MQNWLPSVARLRQELNPQFQALRKRLLNDPYYRLQSTEEIAAAAALGIQIDVNQASVDDWLRLPGLSIHQARSLVELSRSGVQFYCLEDIAAALSLPPQRLKPLEPLLKFCYYDESLCTSQLVNPNTATVEKLAQIPGVDLSLAIAVVQNRILAGHYRNMADFQRRLKVPGDLTAQLMHYLRF